MKCQMNAISACPFRTNSIWRGLGLNRTPILTLGCCRRKASTVSGSCRDRSIAAAQSDAEALVEVRQSLCGPVGTCRMTRVHQIVRLYKVCGACVVGPSPYRHPPRCHPACDRFMVRSGRRNLSAGQPKCTDARQGNLKTGPGPHRTVLPRESRGSMVNVRVKRMLIRVIWKVA